MRLLRCTDTGEFSLTQFHDEAIPPYAILSHTWGAETEEVSYEDFTNGTGKDKPGYEKIRFCGKQIALDNLEYFWIDTCCIRKTSDAELTEAINSMYRWYRDSIKCYVYLTDVSSIGQIPMSTAIERSRWFTRGWTLQELLAPSVVKFFTKEGEFLGSKESLGGRISNITQIPAKALNGTPLEQFGVEERMKWAKCRNTTRKEDAAYSLLGIFGVYMPLIYGEGDHAFDRLREKIMHRQYMKPETLEKLFDSLKFEHIEDRYNNIRVAHADTCRWLLNNEVYQCWLDETHIAQHHGLLWLKGKPGSGKSTLIKFALSKISIQRREDIHISFFFNARGTLLEKDTRGMYRSLLFQVLAKLEKATEVFEEFDIFELPQTPQFSWTIPQLQAVFRRALRKLGRRWLWIYVDALDECDEEQVRDMVAFFRTIGDYSMRANNKLRIFFASRYYPQISIQNKVELKLEDEQEHFLDIARYVNSELKTGVHTQSAAVERIRQEVIGRASGVFIWVFLVVRILNKAYDHGQIIGLERKLKEIPNDLSLLFKEILTRDRGNVEAMQLCIHWILFAGRPLTRRELYYAVHAGAQPEDVGDMNPDNITDEVMDAFILSSSKGLAELTSSKEPVVQFIHETMREFLLKGDGVQHIQGTSNRSLKGIAHDSLRKCCETYISSAEPVLLQHPLTQAYLRRIMGTSGYASMGPAESYESLPLQRLPFINYAVSFILYHANVAEADDVPQDSFLRRFDVSSWRDMANIVTPWKKPLLRYGKPYSPRWSLPYILAMQDHGSLIVAWKRVKPSATMDEGAPLSSIRVALEWCNHNSVRALLTLTWAASPTDFDPSESELNSLMYAYHHCSQQARSSSSISDLLFHWGSEKDVLTLVRCGTFGDSDISTATRNSLLAFAVDRGYETVTKFLLSDPHVDCNRQDSLGFTPLIRAAREGREKFVPLLLECAQIDVNLQCLAGRSALSYAVDKGQEEICKQLLQHRQIKTNLRDKKGRTPFFYACMSGQEAIVDLFLEIDGMDIISRDNMSQTALSYATMNGHKNVVSRLLGVKQVDVNSQDNIHGRTPLIFALENGYHSIARLLLTRPDIDVDICTKAGKSPLDFARCGGMQEETHMIAQLIRAKRNFTSDPELSEADDLDID